MIDFEKAVKDCKPPTQVEIEVAWKIYQIKLLRDSFVIFNIMVLTGTVSIGAFANVIFDSIFIIALGAVLGAVLGTIAGISYLEKDFFSAVNPFSASLPKIKLDSMHNFIKTAEYVGKVNKQNRNLVQGEIDALNNLETTKKVREADMRGQTKPENNSKPCDPSSPKGVQNDCK